MSNIIELPDFDSKDAVFLLFLLKGYTLYIDNLPELTGFQDAPQRAFRLRAMGLPIHDTKRSLPPKYKTPIAFYSLNKSLVIDGIGEKRTEAFIERVEKAFANNADMQKGLRQSKPQPLKAILSGQAINSEVTS